MSSLRLPVREDLPVNLWQRWVLRSSHPVTFLFLLKEEFLFDASSTSFSSTSFSRKKSKASGNPSIGQGARTVEGGKMNYKLMY